ncbi:MAG: hypothetical protein ACRD6B_12615 [Bryobacteraceae bacterium]
MSWIRTFLTICCCLPLLGMECLAQSLSVSPNPVYVADNSGLAQVTLYYYAPGYSDIAIYVSGPDKLLCEGGGGSGSCTTGKWVTNGMTFYMVDATTGQYLTATTVTVTMATPNVGFSAIFNPVVVGSAGQQGTTTFFYNAPGYSSVSVHIGVSKAFVCSSGGNSGACTASNINNGDDFLLIDDSTGNVIASTNVGVVPSAGTGCYASAAAHGFQLAKGGPPSNRRLRTAARIKHS